MNQFPLYRGNITKRKINIFEMEKRYTSKKEIKSHKVENLKYLYAKQIKQYGIPDITLHF